MKSKNIQCLALAFVLCASLTSICSTSILPNEYSIITENENEVVSPERTIELFQRWKEIHQKEYKDPAEEEKRLENFKNNLKYVTQKNGAQKSDSPSSLGHRVGLNKFADMSNEEFRQKYLSKVKRPTADRRHVEALERRKAEKCDPPASLDWRTKGVVTQVKDQGECGSCWAFSTTGAIEGINALSTGNLISLSEQELVDCDTTNLGCDGGDMDYAFAWVIQNGGIDSGADYPYTSIDGLDGTCNVTKEITDKVVSITGYEDVYPSDSALLCAVIQQPISVGMDGSPLDFQLYTGGIYNGSCSPDPDDIDHAVLIVGYGSVDGVDYWIVKNSWGIYWGLDGYFLIVRNTDLPFGKCAINDMASYPTKETSSTFGANKRKFGKHKFGMKNGNKSKAFQSLNWIKDRFASMF